MVRREVGLWYGFTVGGVREEGGGKVGRGGGGTFDVLVGDGLFFEDDPGALDEGAEPAGVEL
jgi:hypothetical protein